MAVKGIFDGISGAGVESMRICFNANKKSYKSGETIISDLKSENEVGIVTKGLVEITRFDFDGNRAILERLGENGIFGSCFSVIGDAENISVICAEDSEIMFVDYFHLVKRCPNACEHHSRLVSNMLQILSEKSKSLSARIEVLSQRTLRNKLLIYFEMLSKSTGSRNIKLSFSLSSLADYLCVDRSAMLREMKKMRDEGIISSKATKITLLKDDLINI